MNKLLTVVLAWVAVFSLPSARCAGSVTGNVISPTDGVAPADMASRAAGAIQRQNIDGLSLQLAKPGESLLHVLSPTLLELKLIDTKDPGTGPLKNWNFVSASGQVTMPAAAKFAVTIAGRTLPVQAVGFKRRVVSAPLLQYDLRVENSIYLQLSSAVADGDFVQVTNPDGSLWSGTTLFQASCDPVRYSPAIHVNQEGYVPSLPKKAMIGYFLGDMGEMAVSATSGFALVDARTGAVVYRGSLVLRQDVGYNTSPAPYQKVLMADFSDFVTPGEYQLQVAGLGASLPFLINDGIAMGFARTYALGLYHQRCGSDNSLPFTRFIHDACHTAPAQIPVQGDPQFAFTWATIASYGSEVGADNPAQIAPKLTSEASQLYPFVNKGTVDVSGGHHDAGDYSKYTSNSAELIHYLMFTVDSIPGVAAMDNLGIPESGDGISDVLQEAKIEADYIGKLQDADGGFYFLTYPKNREYESGTQPDHGDPQVVWPKNTSVSAASVAALAEAASSPLMKKTYPAAAAKYLQQAKLGWQFLTNAIAKYGKAGAYQKITFYSDHFTHDDELAWAACAMFVATGDTQYQKQLFAWFPNPSDSSTFRWGWWRMSECYGNAIRTYAFAARSGRLPQSALDAAYLANCESQVVAAGDDALSWSGQNAYATPFPIATKRVQGAGWYFSLDQASDMAVAYQISAKPAYIDALVGAMNYEGGTNPVNVMYLTGLGLKRQREIVHQYAQSDRRVLPQSGIPLGNIQASFDYLQKYGSELSNLSYPSDNATTGPYPFYDRWADTFNVTTELITVNQARSAMATCFLATRTASATVAWKSAPAQITVPATVASLDAPTTLSVQVPGMDISSARIVWEARDQEPQFGTTYSITPKTNGAQWVEVEIEWPDGRRSVGSSTFMANSPVVTWLAGALPPSAVPGAGGGDNWSWSAANPPPGLSGLSHQSSLASGVHEHWFTGAAATLDISAGDTLFAWVYLDPASPPKEVMLAWNDGASWEHRAFWGADLVTYGTTGTASRYAAGALPPVGQWVKLSVPAKAVGLEGRVLSGMDFTLYDGRASWNASGKSNADAATTTSSPAVSGTTTSGTPASAGSAPTTSAPSVPLPPATSRLVNLSVRSIAGTGDQTLTVGFVINGSGSKQMLVRTVGPTLSTFGVTGVAPDPGLKLFNGNSVLVSENDVWGGSATLASAFASVGAFALPTNSKDSALYLPVAAGANTAQITSPSGTGVALVEAYDADAGTPATQLVNFSARNQVGTGANTLVIGFVISGTTPVTLLIRGIGPALTQFGIQGALADPQLTLFDGNGALVGQNDNWGGGATLSTAFAQAGAFALPAGSKDAALLVTLQPGLYTAQVSGAGSTTGVGLVEVYQMR